MTVGQLLAEHAIRVPFAHRKSRPAYGQQYKTSFAAGEETLAKFTRLEASIERPPQLSRAMYVRQQAVEVEERLYVQQLCRNLHARQQAVNVEEQLHRINQVDEA